MKVCPQSWHLPNNAEWDALKAAADRDLAGVKLKAKSGWNNNGNGTDDYGFSALPGGYGNDGDTKGTFGGVGDGASYWSASEHEHRSYGAHYRVFNWNRKDFLWFSNYKSALLSVRCVKD